MPAVATFSDLFARLDPDPRVRGKQFEHVCKWFLTNDPMYKHRLQTNYSSVPPSGSSLARSHGCSDTRFNTSW
jgi:hypothetical protein